ncbi:dihydrodipicolinate synthase family protein [Maribellus sediminis]|uniref:dihydrodipicolinate synthase family protein n=1 Tax=Maribellus sediminis TaxID=2696285 RepID=UPI00142FB15B|nr:dihydrodipicolinate synthase family protein [Maribellus sediminis]
MQKLKGLIAAPFTPMFEDGTLNLGLISPYAEKLKRDGVGGVFICGTTGEGMLMSPEERMAVAEAWLKEQQPDFKVIVHVGTTSYVQSKSLAKHAQEIGAYAVGCMGPTFLKPGNTDDLIRFCTEVASGAPMLPFYYYHIPTVSDVWLSMPEFLNKAQSVIPNLAGIKFTHRNMMEMMQCMNADNGKWDILHGFDEELLCGLSVGAEAAIGSTYNYMAPLYLKLMDAFNSGDLASARMYQAKSVEFIEILIRYGGGVIGGKPVLKMLGLDCGPLRAPAHNLSEEKFDQYKKELENLGFFNWI